MASERNSLRFDAAVATLVGFLALIVSAYTAYEQHLQVRAQVWPILEITAGNVPVAVHLANKGVGPALVREVLLRVDGVLAHDWEAVLTRILGPGEHGYYNNSLNRRVIAAGESFDMIRPHDDKGNDLNGGKDQTLANKVWEARSRVTIDVCYCSTLDECWMLHANPSRSPVTEPTRHCPAPSDDSFDD